MKFSANTALIFVVLSLILLSLACAGNNAPESGPGPDPDPGTVSRDQEESPYLTAEIIAKRLVLYRTALQENDIATFMAMEGSFDEDKVPDLAALINKTWWSIDWEGAHLNPLEPAAITAMEQTVFPLISVNVEEADDENGWVLLVLSFDPDLIKRLVSQAHTEWPQDQHAVYMSTYMEPCVQVWCIKLEGEWEVLANFDCQPDVTIPERPIPSDDLFVFEDEPEIPVTDPAEGE